MAQQNETQETGTKRNLQPGSDTKAAACNLDDASSPAEIDECIRQTRAQMDDTLKVIERRLAPDNLFDQTMHYVRQNYKRQISWLSNLPQRMNTNPAPFVMIGAGMLLGGIGITGYAMSKQRKKAGPIPSERLPQKREQTLPETISPDEVYAHENASVGKNELYLRADPETFTGLQENQASTEEIVRDQIDQEKDVQEKAEDPGEPLIIIP